jgi:hypothetical protein
MLSNEEKKAVIGLLPFHLNKALSNLKGEKWVDVDGFEGYYKVSNLGRVKTLSRTVPHWKDKSVFCVRKEKVLSQKITNMGYCSVALVSPFTNKKSIAVHRLVAIAFYGMQEDKQVNHINGIKTDNRVENLEWVTNKENINHAISNGLKPDISGVGHFKTKLSETDIMNIRERAKNGKRGIKVQLAKEYGIYHTAIIKIIKGQTWKNIPL